MKPKIGIVPSRTVNQTRPFKDVFTFVNNYPKRVAKAGGIPIGLLFGDSKFKEEYLDIYDGFLIPGGSRVSAYQLAVIHYAITNNKPLLGVCLGYQALGAYSYVVDKLENQNIVPAYDKIIKFFETLDDDLLFLQKVEGHNNEPEFSYSNIQNSKHKVFINKDTYLYEIYKTNEIEKPSIHNFTIKENGKNFKISGISEDGYIEAIEHKNPKYFVIGTQFHPELEDNNDILFERFIEETKKRKWLYHFFLLKK